MLRNALTQECDEKVKETNYSAFLAVFFDTIILLSSMKKSCLSSLLLIGSTITKKGVTNGCIKTIQ